MLSRVDQVAQLCGHIRELSRSNDAERIHKELKLILNSDQFRTSHRSSAFLQYVVEKALHGDFDALKERLLGVELFGRDPLFDTDRDSVVRVAANDVRKRLREHYHKRSQSSVRISLPSGVYIPQIEILPEKSSGRLESEPSPASLPPVLPRRRYAVPVLLACGALAIIASFGIYAYRKAPSAATTLPWSALLKGGKQIDIVVADANLVISKVRAGHGVPIETYASHGFAYAPDLPGRFGIYLNEIPLTTVSDAILAVRISGLAAKAGSRAQVRYCNRFDISELRGDVPIVFFGSPMSNPWVEFLYDQLNFQVVHRFDSGREVCINRHPKSGELPIYFASRNRTGLSEGYALIALEPNLAGRAPVLIVAGTSTEATEAAGEFVTNLDRLSNSLKKLGIDPRSSFQHLELVIKTSYVSAASARSEVVAFRVQ